MQNRWSDENGTELDGLDALVYATHAIGEEPELVLWGGGNSSAKVIAKDHVGREVHVLWVKGSGSDMRTITPKQFTPLRLEELLLLESRDHMTDEEMVAYQMRCLLEPNAPKPSIETLLHAFLPSRYVFHTHTNAICTLTDTSDSAKFIAQVYGDNASLVPYVRPGFRLAKLVWEAYRQSPRARGIILDKHGLVTWGDTAKEAYEATIELVSKAEDFIHARTRIRVESSKASSNHISVPARIRCAALVAPILRGAISKERRMLLAYDGSDSVLEFVNDPRAEMLSQIGPFTPDHILHTKPKPMFLQFPSSHSQQEMAEAVYQAVERYRQEYIRYFERYKSPGVTMMDPYPRVILVPGVGLFASGKDRRACRITQDLYCQTMKVIRHASTLDSYRPIAPQEMCDFEYWPMENYKLTLLPQEKEMSRRIVLITGAAGGIGRALATRFVAEGASVVLTDINEAKLLAISEELNSASGERNTVPIAMDVTDEGNVKDAFQEAILAYGGLDILVSNAGIARGASVSELSFADWTQSLAVNATGNFLVCREGMRIFQRQGLGGNIVVVATKNVLAPGKEFGAYSASKAAQMQLSRVLAIEGSDYRVRVNMVNPDGIFEGSGLWSPEIRQARAKTYGIQVEQIEEYYAGRNLLKVRVTAEDVAEAALFLASERSGKTTGAMIPVDGGAREAFPR